MNLGVHGATPTTAQTHSRLKRISERIPSCDFVSFVVSGCCAVLTTKSRLQLRCTELNFLGANMAEPTYEELKAKLAELEKQQGTRRTGSLEFRVGEKGGVSVYGLGRFPVTLYYEQWNRLLDAAEKLREFLEENKSKLKLKE